MKLATEIEKWGKIKPYFDKTYQFNSIDIETYDNELFLFGYFRFGEYQYTLDNFYQVFNTFLIDCVRKKHDILTWSRYDNTHILKLILKDVKDVNKILLRIGKVTPIYQYTFKSYQFTIVNIIQDSIIFKIDDGMNKPRNCIIYNLKNLFNDHLETVAKNYNLNYYSKLGKEYHIIDKNRFFNDDKYKENVILSNLLDSKVIIDIAYIMLNNFKKITGVYPKSIFTAGSIARSYLLSYKGLEVKDLNFKYLFSKHELFDDLLDYSMKSYHGGKIESYVLGRINKAFVIDIDGAYPYAYSKLPKMTNIIWKFDSTEYLDLFFYAFIRCDITIDNHELIHPIIVKNPLNETNISPVGFLENVIITKIEYDYLIKKGCKGHVYDYIGIEHEAGVFPYKELIDNLFNSRNETDNISLADLYKTIINSLYGISYELTDIFVEDDNIDWVGYRAGDFFNPVIASYITATVRTYLSEVSSNIIENGGEVYLNMTDSIIFDGNVSLDVFRADKKVLGKFSPPEPISDVIILGAGRYEYKKDFNKKYIIKNRGFSVEVKDKSFYSYLNLTSKLEIEHKTFVSYFKATTNKFNFEMMGHLIEDKYLINPFNIGGKRVIVNPNVNLNKNYTKTLAIKLEKGLL